mmetsp:Transcript_40304/g.114103  ORF Transcript_40304/g.114103 Transcript_40304/m.114103 type:complete len:393 (-) Transcript_40304:85-1263(-)
MGLPLPGPKRKARHSSVAPMPGDGEADGQCAEDSPSSPQCDDLHCTSSALDDQEMSIKLDMDLHSLLFLCTLQEFYAFLKGEKIKNVNGITAVIYCFSLMATFIQSYFMLSLYSWNDWEAVRSAVFSSGDVQELAVERLLGSLLLYFFVMPEAISALRTMVLWWFIRSRVHSGTRSVMEVEAQRGWIIYPMRGFVLIVYAAKLMMGIGTGVLAVSICYSTPDEEGVQGILMDFTGLLIIIEIDNIMVPFALELAEQIGSLGSVSLQGLATDFLDNRFKIRFRECKHRLRAELVVRYFILVFIGITSTVIAVMVAFEDMHLGKCYVEDFSAWKGLFMTMQAHFCPDTQPNPNSRCLNYDLYSKCSPDSSFCEQLFDGRIDESTIFIEKTQCQM